MKTSILVTLKKLAALVREKIMYYRDLPDELFELEIPEGATVIEH